MVSAWNKERGNGCDGLGLCNDGRGRGRENDKTGWHNDRLLLLLLLPLLCLCFVLSLLLLYSVLKYWRGGIYFFLSF